MATTRILYVTGHWPAADSSGARLRAWHVARALKAVGEVHVLPVGARAVDAEAEQRTRDEFTLEGRIEVLPARRRTTWTKIQRGLRPRYAYPEGLAADAQAQERVRARLPDFDLVWFFQLRTANLFDAGRWAHTVVDIDDIPSLYERSAWRNLRGRPRWRAGVQALILRRRERLLDGRFALFGVCSEADARYLDLRAPVHVIPNGFARPARDPSPSPASPPRLGFIGVFNYAPNADGVRWFVRHCWPRIKAQVPDCRLRLAGKGSDAFARGLGSDIDGLGWVPDAAAEIAGWTGMVVPIRFGAGMRIKLAQAFGSRCPVVATTYGAYGYDVASGRELLLADDPAAFADACVSLIRDPGAGRERAERAWRRYLQHWTWDAVAPGVHAAAEECLRIGGRARG